MQTRKRKEIGDAWADNDLPLVSIITCVFNGEKYIAKLLDSVMTMGYPRVEHIIVDDGSTDSTPRILLSYKSRYGNKEGSNYSLKIITQPNMGLGGATNVALSEVTGVFWTWINADDWYENWIFNKAIDFLSKHPKMDGVLFNRWVIDESTGKRYKCVKGKRRLMFLNSRTISRSIFQFRYLHLHFLVRTSACDSINPSRQIIPFRKTQDVQFASQYITHLKFAFFSNPCIYFLKRRDSWEAKMKDVVLPGEPTHYEAKVGSISFLNISETIKNSEENLYELNNYWAPFRRAFYSQNSVLLKHIMRDIVDRKHRLVPCHRKYINKRFYIYYAITKLGLLWNICIKRRQMLNRTP